MSMQDMNNTDLLLAYQNARAAYKKAGDKKVALEQEILVRMGVGCYEIDSNGREKFVEAKAKTGTLRGIGIKAILKRKKKAGGINAKLMMADGIDVSKYRGADILARDWHIA